MSKEKLKKFIKRLLKRFLHKRMLVGLIITGIIYAIIFRRNTPVHAKLLSDSELYFIRFCKFFKRATSPTLPPEHMANYVRLSHPMPTFPVVSNGFSKELIVLAGAGFILSAAAYGVAYVLDQNE